MSIWNTYHIAHSLTDALETLANSPGAARPIAGGTDLLVDLQHGRMPPVHTLVDISQVPELGLIEERRGMLFIGAGATLNRIISSTAVQRHAPALIDAASLIGGPQVRNSATLGGNVAHALPAADGTIALLALDGQAEVASQQERSIRSLEALFRGPGISALDPAREVLVGFHVPLRAQNNGSAFRRVMRPQGVAIAILNIAVWLELSGDTIKDIRIAIGPAGPVPLRARFTEDILRGACLDLAVLEKARIALLAESHFRTSPHRSTEEYRRHMAGILLTEAIDIARLRAGGVLSDDHDRNNY